jgi:hypothetical protein
MQIWTDGCTITTTNANATESIASTRRLGSLLSIAFRWLGKLWGRIAKDQILQYPHKKGTEESGKSLSKFTAAFVLSQECFKIQSHADCFGMTLYFKSDSLPEESE